MLRVCRYCPRLAFRGPWSGAPAAVQLATAPIFNGRVLARPARPGLCTAPAPRPTRPETRCLARFDKFCVVNFIHYLFPSISAAHEVGRSIIALGRRLRGLTLSRGPRTTALGPLLQRRETRLADGFPGTRLMLLEQSVADQ